MTSSADYLLNELRQIGVSVGVQGGRIWYEPRAAVDADLLERIRRHKPELVTALTAGLVDAQPPGCSPHNDPRNYVDEPAPRRAGWIRTTCKQCGRFVGYRRDDGKQIRRAVP